MARLKKEIQLFNTQACFHEISQISDRALRYDTAPPDYRFGIATSGSYERQDQAIPFF